MGHGASNNSKVKSKELWEKISPAPLSPLSSLSPLSPSSSSSPTLRVRVSVSERDANATSPLFPIPHSAYLQFIWTDMLTIKRKQITWIIFLLVGLGYFSAMSNLEIHYFWKSLIAFMPIQMVAVLYVTFQRWSRSYQRTNS